MTESVVDYAAWRKGYMPPSEHILIHELSVGSVKVVLSFDAGTTGYWLVTRNGQLPSHKTRLAILKMLEEMCDDEPEDVHPLASDVALAGEPT